MTPPTRSSMHIIFWIGALTLIAPSMATGAEPEPVYVLEHGGVEVLQVLSPQRTGDQRSIARGTTRIRQSLVQAQTVEDLRVLSDGLLLLSGLGQKIVATVDPMTLDTQTLYTASSPLSRIDTIAVASTSAFGTPQRLLIGDAGIGVVSIEDVLLNKTVWAQRFFMPGGQSDFAETIVLPGEVIVVATTWTGIDIYSIDVVRINDPAPMNTTRLTNAPNPNHPPQTIILPDLGPLRDIFAIDEERLIVTTRFEIFEINLQGDIAWRIRASDDLELGGEFAGARMTPNGGLAVATFEPGFWVQPHPNHRVHWYDLDTPSPTRTLSSGALTRAPKRITPVGFVGASGTFNRAGGIEGALDGEVSDLVISDGPTLSSTQVSPSDVLRLGLTLTNERERNVALQKVGLFATQGAMCGASGQPTRALYDQGPTIIAPMEQLVISSTVTFETDQPLSTGTWCIQARAQDTQGQWKSFEPTIQLDVLEVGMKPKEQVPKEDLRLSNEDMSADLGDMPLDQGSSNGGTDPQEGCGCVSTHSSPSVPWGTLLILGGLIGVCRRRQRVDD